MLVIPELEKEFELLCTLRLTRKVQILILNLSCLVYIIEGMEFSQNCMHIF